MRLQLERGLGNPGLVLRFRYSSGQVFSTVAHPGLSFILGLVEPSSGLTLSLVLIEVAFVRFDFLGNSAAHFHSLGSECLHPHFLLYLPLLPITLLKFLLNSHLRYGEYTFLSVTHFHRRRLCPNLVDHVVIETPGQRLSFLFHLFMHFHY